MKKILLASVFIVFLNAAQESNPPDGAAFNSEPQPVDEIYPRIIQIKPVNIRLIERDQPVRDSIKEEYYSYINLESLHNSMIERVKDEFIQKIKSLCLQDKQVIERYIRAYISCLDELFILRKSTDLDYEFIKANFAHIFAAKQKETVNILTNNPNLYPIINKLSIDTKKIVDKMPKKGFALRQVSPDTKLAFECLKKLYVEIHIDFS